MIEWYSGDTNPVTVTVTDSGSAVESLAGATFTGAIYEVIGGTVAVELANDDFTVSGNVATAYPDTSALAGIYEVEVQVEDASGNVQTTRGTVRIIGDQIT